MIMELIETRGVILNREDAKDAKKGLYALRALCAFAVRFSSVLSACFIELKE